jgi:hypothetical protein
MESVKEIKKCEKCKKSFLPIGYFVKRQAINSHEFNALFSSGEDLHEEDLVKGIYVIW